MERTLLVFVPGFGAPHTREKTRILKNNIDKISANSSVWTKIKFQVAVYDDTILPDEILEQDVDVIYQKGIVGNFIKTHVTPQRLEEDKYDFVLLLLDDVELMEPVDWRRILVAKKLTNADLISPTLTPDSQIVYPYMAHQTNAQHTGITVPKCEFFCFLFDTFSYKRYYPLLDEANAWMWGLDLVLFQEAGLITFLMNTWTVKHHYRGESYKLCDKDPNADMLAYLRRRKYGDISRLVLQPHFSTTHINDMNAHILRMLFDKFYT